MLKYTKQKIQSLTDPQMVLFVRQGIRGVMSQCSGRYAKANNSYRGENFNPNEEVIYLMYYYVNNLYAYGMGEALPYDDFQRVDSFVIKTNPYFFNVPDDNEYGYLLEVSVKYLQTLHSKHNEFTLLPEHRSLPGSKETKLMATLYDKNNYIIHYRALKQASKCGLVLKKVHRAICFRQKAWLKPYIDYNSKRRMNAQNDFEKHLFKLFNNAIYGKMLENPLKRVIVKLVSHWNGPHGAEALISRPNFKSNSIFKENLIAV